MVHPIIQQLQQLDERFLFLVNHRHTPLWDKVAYWITHELFWIPLYVVLLYLLIKKLGRQFWLALASIVILIVLCDQFSSGLIKPWVQRLRPCFNTQLPFSLHIVGKHHGLYGFISSHAANTFGLATFFWLLLRSPYGWVLFLWASLVSYARVYGGVHYPGDVLLGALSGAIWGQLVHFLKPCNQSPDSLSVGSLPKYKPRSVAYI
eukprot:gene2977-3717_t